MINIVENSADFVYCTACGVSWKEKKIYNIVLDNMMFRICEDCLKELKLKIEAE